MKLLRYIPFLMLAALCLIPGVQAASVPGTAPIYFAGLSTAYPYGPRDTRVLDGYASPTDGGGGLFGWNATSTATPDHCTIVQATGFSVGRWQKLYSGPLDVRACGADSTGTVAADAAIGYANIAAAAGNGVVLFPQGTYRLTTSIGPPAGVRWQGAGRGSTTLQQVTPGIDAVLCVDNQNSAISDLTVTASGGNGIHIEGVANGNLERPCVLERVTVQGFGTAARAYTVTAANPAVVSLTAHGFAAGTRIQFNAPILGGYTTPVFNATGNTVTAAGHGLSNGDQVQFNEIFDAGLIPSPLVARTSYYVISATTNTFKLSLTSGGAAIVFTGDNTAHADNILWGIPPGAPTGGAAALGLDPRLEYWVSPTGLTANTFEISSVPPYSGSYPLNVSLSGIPLGTISKNLVGQVAAAVDWDSEGRNIYDGSAYDVQAIGAGGAVSATHAFVTENNGTSYVPIHTMVINGEAEYCKRVFSNRVGELRGFGAHSTDNIDGSGGGLLAYTNAANGLDQRGLRLEIEAIESAFYADSSSFACNIDGTLGFAGHAITDTVGSSTFNLTTGNVPNVGGSYTFGILSQDTIHPYQTLGTNFTGNLSAAGTITATGKVLAPAGLDSAPTAGLPLYADGTFTAYLTPFNWLMLGASQENDVTSGFTGRLTQNVGLATVGSGTVPLDALQLASDQVSRVTMTLGCKRTGGSRGTGAVDDAAVWVRTAVVGMVGANSGTPTVLQSSATLDTDYVASDLTSAGVTFSGFNPASGGVLNFTVSGAANLNLKWTAHFEISPVM